MKLTPFPPLLTREGAIISQKKALPLLAPTGAGKRGRERVGEFPAKIDCLNKLGVTFAFFLLFPVLLLLSCNPTQPDLAGGSSSKGGNALVSGYLLDECGQPVKDAKVLFIPVNNDPYASAKKLAATDSVVTDSNGRYAINTLPYNNYNVFGADDQGNFSKHDSIDFHGDTVNALYDTLKRGGSVAGYVKMHANDDPRNIRAAVIGSAKLAFISSDAGFALDSLARGKYPVRFYSMHPDYANVDTFLSVQSGINGVLGDSIVMPLTIPIPANFSLVYDTLRQYVTLSWNRADTSKVSGYNVYRQRTDSASAEAKMNVTPITDTFYLDTTCLQDAVYQYRVSSINKPGTAEGRKSGVLVVTIESAFKFIRQIGTYGTGQGQYQNPVAVSGDDQGNVFVTDYDQNKIIFYDTAGNFKKELSGLNGPIGFIRKNNNCFYAFEMDSFIIKQIDSAGNIIHHFGGIGTFNGYFGNQNFPWIASIASNGNLFIPDLGNNRIQLFDSIGTYINNISLGGPYSLALLNDTALAVGFNNGTSDWGLQIIGMDGTINKKWNCLTRNNICITNGGNILASSNLNGGLISIYSVNGQLIARFGRQGISLPYFTFLKGAVIASGKLIISDSQGHKVLLFSMPDI